MGGASSTTSTNGAPLTQLYAKLKFGSRVDAIDGNGVWWPSVVVALHTEGRKPYYTLSGQEPLSPT
jgi:hypothetical protein